MMKEAKSVEMTKYQKINTHSTHGGVFTIEDDDEDLENNDSEVEIQFRHGKKKTPERSSGENTHEIGGSLSLCSFWNTITFAWMDELLKKSHEKPLEQTDLHELQPEDRADSIYQRFIQYWEPQLHSTSGASPSLTMAFIQAFGKPFLAAGFLKFIHDTTLFLCPYLLNHLIVFLSDPSQPTRVGLMYVLGLFLANLIMSLCLRQYFWWCYRVGMNLRSAVITSVYHKSLVLSPGTFARKTTGEITNLMSVDSSRLQDLTPYLHAIWYSFYQIVVAMCFLWQQLGISCLAGMAIIVISIPITGKISQYMKSLQKQLSSIRDQRIKLTNEVLSGMKVIKLQAWEKEFQQRIMDIRQKEMTVFQRYAIFQSISGSIFTMIPLLVSITTFIAYIALGNQLTVAKALTSLALFEVLRFPLFMFPQVLNNVVEAKVSIDRVQSFLLEQEHDIIPVYPLRKIGFYLYKACFAYDGLIEQLIQKNVTQQTPAASSSSNESIPASNWVQWCMNTSNWQYMFRYIINLITCTLCQPCIFPTTNTPSTAKEINKITPQEVDLIVKNSLLSDAENQINTLMHELHDLQSRYNQVIQEQSTQTLDEEPLLTKETVDLTSSASSKPIQGNKENFFSGLPDNFLSVDYLYQDQPTLGLSPVSSLNNNNSANNNNNTMSRILTLSHVSTFGARKQLTMIIGTVGSGKSSFVNSLLGNLKLHYGQVAVNGRIAYTAQLPFIHNNTVRNNILYNTMYDEERYQRTIDMCALRHDLSILPGGDMTEIGERGINLSGGQKARVGLARAVYADADLYLLDDPLSAVDAHVGKHLFEECILTLRNDYEKCILLVTNALQYTKYADQIIVLKDGHILDMGTQSELLQRCTAYQDMMTTVQDNSSSISSSISANKKSKASLETDENDGNKEESIKEKESSVKKPTPESSKKLKNIESEPKPTNSKKENEEKGKLMTTEDREIGHVDWKVYQSWAQAAGGASLIVFCMIIFFYGNEAVNIFGSYWLSYWSKQTANPSSASTPSPWWYLGIYIVINVFIILVNFVKELYVRLISLVASRELFTTLLNHILYAPMHFYDMTPLGRIINRFSKDIYTIDEQIPQTIRGYLTTMAKVTGILLYIVIITPLFIVIFIPILIFYVLAQRYYIQTSRELTRIESVSRSPIYALFTETLDGLTTIRAFQQERSFVYKNYQLLNTNCQAYFYNFSANCWLAVRLEFIGTLIVTFAALFAVLGRAHYIHHNDSTDSTSEEDNSALLTYAGLAGLSISLALSITQSLNWTVRMASDMESQMISVERVQSYTRIDQEQAHYLSSDPLTRVHTLSNNRNNNQTTTNAMFTSASSSAASSYWPNQPIIVFDQVNLRYRPNLPLVLNQLSVTIPAYSKIGICGRTGAGKSSLVTALLRLVEAESGGILIDGVNIASIGLNTLRSIMAVIPQDPVLFSGTIRSNLDPFNRYSDTELWESLQRTLLHTCIQSLEDTVQENGNNYSVGQRQLLCIARALLSKAKIIIMDEATAAVDIETDALIQKTIREEFTQATCLTIAHRLNTIMDSDYVLVMDCGHVAEFDSPANLLANDQSMFYSLANSHEED